LRAGTEWEIYAIGSMRPAQQGAGRAKEKQGIRTRTMHHVGRWVVGFMVAVIGLFALYLASQAEEPVMYYFGLALFVASVLFNFLQIKQVFDEQGRH
jgi:uncharacterized membrane protein